MSLRTMAVFAVALVSLAPAASHASLASYSQDFESLVQTDPAALQNDGWLVYGNVYTPAHVFIYGYGAFPAPNPGGGFCAIDAGQGGVPQGAQQLSVYNDYNNLDHANNRLIEANVFREQTISAADVGKTWVFTFDAKLGNLVSPSTAFAFVKTLDPNAGFATTHFVTSDMTTIPTSWGTFPIQLSIFPSMVGQIAQFGFSNTATAYAGSGVFYDNLSWLPLVPTGVTDAPGRERLELRTAAPNPFLTSTRIEYSIARASVADLSVFDITGRRVATLFHGPAEPGSHSVVWRGRSDNGQSAPSGVYQCVLQTVDGRQVRKLVLGR
ncbi:MAG: T9SS type A sorting domain-containing protein [Candidatus Eisenbacteria bacterium]|uniref:T9SS type A sorting domain-containing protein n=1 Tax=Eiseniibacteriota bacterium TaxID=2212470 RepID=A0A849SV92_UNCEI|nr:T9SS type A sorting domain-containing protein [Candidatus Eisenbacteria bacterium]